jgi:hypothetical protein
MIHLQTPFSRLVAGLFVTLSTLLLIGCASDRGPRGSRGEIPFVVVSLEGTGEYLGGQLMVTARVSNAPLHRPPADGRQTSGGAGRPDRGPEGGPGGGVAGGMGMGGNPGGGMRGGPGGMGSMGSNQPPLLLVVGFENKGSAPLTVIIRDVDSLLGNFVPQPETLTLAPGQSATLEPMISRMGLIANELELKLSLRSAGGIESQTLLLKNVRPVHN